MLVDGQPTAFESARDARVAGIESLYQDLALVDTMSVADNIFLGREMLELADHLLVMRAGRVRVTLSPKETTLGDLAELMVGSA